MTRAIYTLVCESCNKSYTVDRLYRLTKSRYCSRFCFYSSNSCIAGKREPRGAMSEEHKIKHREGALKAGCGKWMKNKTGENANAYIDGRSIRGETARDSARKRRLKKKNISGSHTERQWLQVKNDWGNKCLCCKKKEPEVVLTRDHVISVYNNGSDNIENIQPLCLSCNARKSWMNIDFRILELLNR